MNIFSVDYNEVDALLFRRAFKNTGDNSSIMRARVGVEALEILRGESTGIEIPEPFVVLLDINMTRMNGLEFLEKLRADEDVASTRVVVLT